MAMWDKLFRQDAAEKPVHERYALRDDTFLDIYAPNAGAAKKTLEAYVGEDTAHRWRSAPFYGYRTEPYDGTKRGMEINYTARVRDDVAIPEMAEPVRVKLAGLAEREPGAQAERPSTGRDAVEILRDPERRQVVININLAALELAPPQPEPEVAANMRRAFDSTLKTALQRVDAFTHELEHREEEIRRAVPVPGPSSAAGAGPAASEHRARFEGALTHGQAGSPSSGGAVSVVRQSAEATLRDAKADMVQVVGHVQSVGPDQPLTHLRTITDAVKEVAGRPGVQTLVSADWASFTRVREQTPNDLLKNIEAVRRQLEPDSQGLKVYEVREDGTIRNTATGRDEYIPVGPHTRQSHPDLQTALDRQHRSAEMNARPNGAQAHVPAPEITVS